MSKRLFFLFFLAYSSVVTAATYYVAPNGADGTNGTKEKPWASWKKAFQTAQAGDTVYFRGGIYSISLRTDLVTASNSGTAENPIIFINYPSETPILDCTAVAPNNYDNIIKLYNGKNYITIKGLTIKNLLASSSMLIHGIYIESCNNITIENCVIENIETKSMLVACSDEVLVKNCDAINCLDSHYARPGTSGDGFTWNSTISSCGAGATNMNIKFEGCRAWGMADNGFAGPGEGYVEMESCWAFNNGFLYGEGCGFKYGWNDQQNETLNPSRLVHNCIAVNNGNYGFGPNSAAAYSFHVYNNLSYHNGYRRNSGYQAGFGVGFISDCGHVASVNEMFSNNIAYANEYMDFRECVPTHHEYNSWDTPSGVTVTDNDFISLDTLQLLLPRQADGSLPDIDFGKLAPGSDLIDAGTTKAGLPYNGSAPDLGWHESSPTIPISPSAPVYNSSVIENATPSRLEMTYNLTLANIVPATSAFTVMVNSSARSVTSVSISGNKVFLILSVPVAYGEAATVAYTKPASNPLQTASGGQAASIIAQTVTNNCYAPAANNYPIISISSPTKSTSFIAPATITIDAVASDLDGTIASVEFYSGTTKLGERTTSPYFYTWKDVNAGTYSITAVAIDNQNARSVSAPVSVIVEKSATAVNQLPVVSITLPVNKEAKKHGNIIIKAEASDPDGSISKVELKSGGITLTEMTTTPYTYTMLDVDTGTYVITAIATDNLGAVGISSAIELKVEDFYDANSEILNLYPNPNNGQFKIDIFSDLPDQDNRLTIFSLSGKTVYNEVITSEENSRAFDLSNSAPGTYVLMITSGETILSTKKFVRN